MKAVTDQTLTVTPRQALRENGRARIIGALAAGIGWALLVLVPAWPGTGDYATWWDYLARSEWLNWLPGFISVQILPALIVLILFPMRASLGSPWDPSRAEYLANEWTRSPLDSSNDDDDEDAAIATAATKATHQPRANRSWFRVIIMNALLLAATVVLATGYNGLDLIMRGTGSSLSIMDRVESVKCIAQLPFDTVLFLFGLLLVVFNVATRFASVRLPGDNEIPASVVAEEATRGGQHD